jgi:hypothetical protein
MNLTLNPQQSDTKSGPIALKATADLTGLESRLVKIANSSGTAKFALPSAVTDLALFVLASGNPAANDNWAEQPEPGANFRVRLNGTCVPGDVLVLCDPAASSGANAGKVEALGATAGAYFSVGIAQETGVDEQLVLARFLPRLVQRSAAFTGSTPTATGATNSSPYGFTTSAQADALVTTVREMRTQLIALGLMS